MSLIVDGEPEHGVVWHRLSGMETSGPDTKASYH